jgi:hypothetical protein
VLCIGPRGICIHAVLLSRVVAAQGQSSQCVQKPCCSSLSQGLCVVPCCQRLAEPMGGTRRFMAKHCHVLAQALSTSPPCRPLICGRQVMCVHTDTSTHRAGCAHMAERNRWQASLLLGQLVWQAALITGTFSVLSLPTLCSSLFSEHENMAENFTLLFL